MKTPLRSRLLRRLAGAIVCLTALSCAAGLRAAPTPLSDIPIYSASNVPANLMMALSVEFPTGTVAAYTDLPGQLVYTDSSGASQSITCAGKVGNLGVCYFPAMRYLGYFDNAKCYTYQANAGAPLTNYFVPVSFAAGACPAGQWSGNMLNWATMTALDEFRQVLTGGNRIVDQPGLTVLQRSRQTAQGSASNFPTKRIGASVNVAPSTVVGDATFSAARDVYIRSHDGTEFSIAGDPNSRGVLFEVSDNAGFVDAPPAKRVKRYYARVQVCAGAAGEANCTAYGGGFKPEGLIQKNADRIRVGATSYLYDSGAERPNGVLRALLRDNGPTTYNGFGLRQPNPNAEWSAGTGVFATNPDPVAAAASGVSKSGAINYLNQFGTVESGYEGHDTLAELYWATLAYYKHVPLDPSFSAPPNPGNSIQLDGLPAITNQTNINDPIQYSCQGNAIVTIGDSHTWCDTRIPGSSKDSSGLSGCVNHAPLAPLLPNGTDPGLNTGAYIKALGNLPLIEAVGTTPPSSTMAQYAATAGDLSAIFEKNGVSRSTTYNMAGMAYYAHTQDIRGDDSAQLNTTGKQTVDTYTVDVMEPGVYDGAVGHEIFDPARLSNGAGPNMYWLAAKYGGFDDVNDDGIPASVLSWHTNASTVAAKDLRPDNYFPGNRPDVIRSGLAQIFNRVASTKVLSAAPPGVSASRSLLVANGSVFNTPLLGAGAPNNFPVYVTSYKPGDWTGNVSGQIDTGTIGSNLTPVGTPWSAQSQLDNLARGNSAATPPLPPAWSTGRRIITFNGGGVPFRMGSLSGTQRGYLNNDSQLLDYLRGDAANEGTKFRVRRHVLGDIVDSSAVLVQSALSPDYTDAVNPGYSAFAASVAGRAPVVYVGANDGMLHAFAADFSQPSAANPVGGGGSELFAYVPSFVLSGPSGTPLVDGLAANANLTGVSANAFNHHFYVDQTPQVGDVDFDWTCASPGTACSAGSLPNWHTLLVGALGKGGRGIYALDVTSVPASVDTSNGASQESTISSKVLWEFTAPDAGFSFGRPLIAKTRKYGWVVLMTSGYANTRPLQSGGGHLYVLNAKTGVLLETLDTHVGSTSSASGLGRATAYTQDVRDGMVEQVYAGDLLGNVWRFDLSNTGAYPAPVLLATLTDGAGVPQPVTTAPRIETDIDSTGLGTRRWVFVGTGKFLDTSDLIDAQQQTMYALRDGSTALPNPATGGPFPLPIARSALVAANLGTSLALSDSAPGWFYDLLGTAGGAAGATERIVVDPDAAAGVGVIAWATLIPTQDPCTFQGAIYAAAFGTGQSALISTSGGGSPTGVPFIQLNNAVTGLQIVELPSSPGSFGLLYGQTGLTVSTAQISTSSAVRPIGRVNWREVMN